MEHEYEEISAQRARKAAYNAFMDKLVLYGVLIATGLLVASLAVCGVVG